MPYKDELKQKQAQHKSYLRNKDKIRRSAWESRKQNRDFLVELKTNGCCNKCGFKHPAVLDFHHLNPSDKEMNISDAIRRHGWGRKRLLKELEKCILLCANCHRILHHEEKYAVC